MKNRSDQVRSNLHRLLSKSFDDILYLQSLEPPNQAQIVTFYTLIANLFHSLNIPIVPYDQLSLTSGTLPADKPLEPSLQAKVSSLLYTKLHSAVPTTWHTIRSILKSYTTTQDGYSALFSIMTNQSGYLRIFRKLWGPPWQHTMNTYKTISPTSANTSTNKAGTDKPIPPTKLQPKSFNRPTSTKDTKSSPPPI
jgi:hypothetical protein